MRVFALLIVLAVTIFSAAPASAQKTAQDDEIYDQVRRRLAGDRDVKGGGIEVEVTDGVVTLRGKVREEKLKQRAERLTLKVKGVKKVINELQADLGETAPPGSKD